MNKSSEEYPLLVAQEGPLKGQRWQLSQTIVLGREASCDVVVADRQISRFHARVTPTPEGVILEDLGSVEMDLAAADQGYRRPKGMGYRIDPSLTFC